MFGAGVIGHFGANKLYFEIFKRFGGRYKISGARFALFVSRFLTSI